MKHLLSHPNHLLHEHLLGVQTIALQYIPTIHSKILSKDSVKELLSVSAYFHDIGKATSFFQNYIRCPKHNRDKDLTSHALISAVYVYEHLQRKYSSQTIIPILGFLIVRYHHGNLPSWDESKYRESLGILSKVGILEKQIKAIDYEQCISHMQSDLSVEFLTLALQSCKSLLRSVLVERKKYDAIELYLLTNLLFSLLIFADKTDAIIQAPLPPLPPFALSASIVLQKAQSLQNQSIISQLRSQIFAEIAQSCMELSDTENILSINAPTGSGKTLAALHAGLLLKERFGLKRIIYCLPFTSIIDQNFGVFSDILKQNALPHDSTQLMLQHHLAPVGYSTENEDYDLNTSLHYIETWHSHFIVSSFVQFFETLVSNKNSSLRKFHRMSNAVILLDEIQSIPHKYWHLLHTMLSQLAEYLQSKIILLTATMPLIFDESKKEIIELLPNKKSYYTQLSRIQLDCSRLHSIIEWNDFCTEIFDTITQEPNKNILIVLNTIASVKEFYESVQKHFPEEPNILFLSTEVIPKHRIKRISEIRSKTTDTKTHRSIVISTQLIEAGVDIDMDIVIRDFAPLDSIFQTAGRCNRNATQSSSGLVRLYQIQRENQLPSKQVYDSFLLGQTRIVLQNKQCIPEDQFLELSKEYFTLVNTYKNNATPYLDAINAYRWGELSDFHIIDKEKYKGPMFVEYDEDASSAWQDYQQALQEPNSFARHANIRQTFQKISQYIVNIPTKYFPKTHKKYGIYRLKPELVTQYYSEQTGFLRINLPEEQSSFFL